MVLIHCDGAIRGGNPGGHGVGGFIIKNFTLLNGVLEYIGTVDLGRCPEMTNNIAEFAAVWAAMNEVIKLGLTQEHIVVKSDSMLVMKNLSGHWKCDVPHLQFMKSEILETIKDFKQIEFHWIPREENKEADAISKSLY